MRWNRKGQNMEKYKRRRKRERRKKDKKRETVNSHLRKGDEKINAETRKTGRRKRGMRKDK